MGEHVRQDVANRGRREDNLEARRFRRERHRGRRSCNEENTLQAPGTAERRHDGESRTKTPPTSLCLRLNLVGGSPALAPSGKGGGTWSGTTTVWPGNKRVSPLPYSNRPLLSQHYHVVVRVALYSRLLVYVYTSAAASTSSSRTITSSCVCNHERCDLFAAAAAVAPAKGGSGVALSVHSRQRRIGKRNFRHASRGCVTSSGTDECRRDPTPFSAFRWGGGCYVRSMKHLVQVLCGVF